MPSLWWTAQWSSCHYSNTRKDKTYSAQSEHHWLDPGIGSSVHNRAPSAPFVSKQLPNSEARCTSSWHSEQSLLHSWTFTSARADERRPRRMIPQASIFAGWIKMREMIMDKWSGRLTCMLWILMRTCVLKMKARESRHIYIHNRIPAVHQSTDEV